MIKSCATIALVPEITAGPWIYWESPDISIPKAAKLGFDAVELFTASADAVKPEQLEQLCDANKIKIAAVGTGAGKVLSATCPIAGLSSVLLICPRLPERDRDWPLRGVR